MAQLIEQTGDVSAALIAYNWGIGNVTTKGAAHAPASSIAYAASIVQDSEA